MRRWRLSTLVLVHALLAVVTPSWGGDQRSRSSGVDARAYKFEYYRFAPMGTDPSSSDWRPIDAETLSAILECRRVEERVDECGFRKGEVVYGFHLEEEDAVRLYRLPFDATMQFVYNNHGRVRRWDLIGDRGPFRQAIADALLDGFHDPEKLHLTPDDVRRLGQRAEQALVYCVLGALDMELPGPGGRVETDADAVTVTWTFTQPPHAARTFIQGVASGNFVGAEVGRQGSVATYEIAGELTEALQPGTLERLIVSGKVAGVVEVDTDRGVIVGQYIAIGYRRQVRGGYTQKLFLLEPWVEGLTPAPGELHGNPLEED